MKKIFVISIWVASFLPCLLVAQIQIPTLFPSDSIELQLDESPWLLFGDPLIQLHKGEIFVLQNQKGTVLRFSQAGQLIGSYGGQTPKEKNFAGSCQRSESIFLMGDTLGILYVSAGNPTLFAYDLNSGEFLREYHLPWTLMDNKGYMLNLLETPFLKAVPGLQRNQFLLPILPLPYDRHHPFQHDSAIGIFQWDPEKDTLPLVEKFGTPIQLLESGYILYLRQTYATPWENGYEFSQPISYQVVHYSSDGKEISAWGQLGAYNSPQKPPIAFPEKLWSKMIKTDPLVELHYRIETCEYLQPIGDPISKFHYRGYRPAIRDTTPENAPKSRLKNPPIYPPSPPRLAKMLQCYQEKPLCLQLYDAQFQLIGDWILRYAKLEIIAAKDKTVWAIGPYREERETLLIYQYNLP